MGARDSIEHGLEALFGEAAAFERAGDLDAAVGVYENWLAREQPSGRHLALFNLGAMLQAKGDDLRAKVAYQQCLQLHPGFCHALINYGLLLEREGLVDAAIEQWSEVVRRRYIVPDISADILVAALNHIGRARESQREYGLAHAALEESLGINSNQPGVIQHLFHIRQKACMWPLDKPLTGISAFQRLTSTSPLGMLAQTDDPAQQLLVNHAFVARTYSLTQKQLYLTQAKSAHSRVRLGYLSGDLCTHAVGLLLPELIRAHDSARFEIYAYDYSRHDGSAHQQLLRALIEHRRDVGTLSDEAIAHAMVEDEIDVLIDLHGLSSGARPGVCALRPAPLQGTYLGFIGTTTMPWFDFVVADRVLAPDTLRPFISEDVLEVEGCLLPWSKSSTTPPPTTQERVSARISLGLPPDAFIFAAFGNSYKINPRLFSSWLRILEESPGSILWLVDDNKTATGNLQRFALESGLASNRLVFTQRMAHGQYRQALALADAFLDTFPYNCGSTAVDVLAAEVPLVTLTGRSMVSRMGASLLAASGGRGQVANSFEEYEAIAVSMAHGAAPRGLSVAGPAGQPTTTKQMVASLERQLLDRLARRQLPRAIRPLSNISPE